VSKAHFNGGGHINAAGGAFDGSLEDAISKFKNNLNSYEKELLIEAAKS
jgi:phosphoesterase RecJ-like protein